VEFTAVGCTVLELTFAFTPVFVHEVAPTDATGVAVEEPLLPPPPLPGALLPPVALLLTTPVFAVVLLAPVFAVPLTFPPD
jgi:hypothetical protein